jgi:hypothetical protein
MARGLRIVTTVTLGLLVPSLRNPANSPIIRGAFDRAWMRTRGWSRSGESTVC